MFPNLEALTGQVFDAIKESRDSEAAAKDARWIAEAALLLRDVRPGEAIGRARRVLAEAYRSIGVRPSWLPEGEYGTREKVTE